MGFGSGHMMDFNNRMKNNRQLRKKDKFKSSVGYLYENNKSTFKFKKQDLTPEEKEEIRKKIQEKIQLEKQRQKYKIFVLVFIIFISIILMLKFLNTQ